MAAAKGSKGSRKGSGKIEEQLLRLAERMTSAEIKIAEALAADVTKHNVVRYAFKKLPKGPVTVIKLSKREQDTYDEIAKISQKTADAWKVERLASKQKEGQED